MSANVTLGKGSMPSISIDSSGILHLYYLPAYSGKAYVIHYQKSYTSGSWSSGDVVYTAALSTDSINYITSWADPTSDAALAWTYTSGSTTNVDFASIPLPYGTAGGSSDPWDGQGISPYATYFTEDGDYVNPGNGQMIYSQTDASVLSRDDMYMNLTILYQQPKYFSKATGTAYGSFAYPSSNLGLYWGLDLPWMNQTYVYIGSGDRYVIQWGNQGNSSQFVNHNGVQFIMNNVNKNGVSYYELITASGVRYQFSATAPYQLQEISNLEGYNPSSSTYSPPYDYISFTYTGNQLTAITDNALGRTIQLKYNSTGLLTQVISPDNGQTSVLVHEGHGQWHVILAPYFSYRPSRARHVVHIQQLDGWLSAEQRNLPYEREGKLDVRQGRYAVDGVHVMAYNERDR